MKALLSALVSLAFAAPALAGVSISKSYPFDFAQIEKLEAAVARAENRAPEAMKHMFYANVDESIKMTLSCLPEYPKAGTKGEGCVLSFAIDIAPGLNFAIKHPVYMKHTAAEIRATLAQKNPSSGEHVNFAGFTDGGSTYNCEPKGAAYECSLFVFSNLN